MPFAHGCSLISPPCRNPVRLDRQTDEVISRFQEALRLKPDYADINNSLAHALGMKIAPASCGFTGGAVGIGGCARKNLAEENLQLAPHDQACQRTVVPATRRPC